MNGRRVTGGGSNAGDAGQLGRVRRVGYYRLRDWRRRRSLRSRGRYGAQRRRRRWRQAR